MFNSRKVDIKITGEQPVTRCRRGIFAWKQKFEPLKKFNSARDWFFRQVHSNHLVYNTCWEDPRCDRQLLDIREDSEIVMITSAGCNALDYLLDEPRRIHCVDVNPRQNALLQLKLATFQNAGYEDLFNLFGEGRHLKVTGLYNNHLRAHLPDYARRFWDENVHYFNGKGIRKSFYHYGTSGLFAWLAHQYLRAHRLLDKVNALFEAENLERQAALYYQLEHRILNSLIEWIINRHFTMCLVGVPRSQQQLFRNKYERGTLGFIQECLRKVFTKQPLHDNYFWKLYLQGHYAQDCCPSYLQAPNFEHLRSGSQRLHTHNDSIAGFLRRHPGCYSHFVLLDHQDWLADNDRPALEEEWQLLLRNSRPGTRILLRSAAHQVDFFPDLVLDRVSFEKEQTMRVHTQDRVGTYASVYLGIVH